MKNPLIQRRLVLVWNVPAAHNWSHLQCNHHHAYMEIFNAFVNHLEDEELSTGYFQQDVATSHTSHANVAEIQSFFGDRVTSKELWPPRSPDLTQPDYLLWGYLKGRVYRNKPRTIDALKANITEEIQGSGSGRTGKDFSKYGAPGSILSARK